MNIVTSWARIDEDDVPDREAGIRLLRKIERKARISHRSEERMTDNSWERFLPTVIMERGDWSVVEHAWVSVEAEVDRGIQQEWTRHRLFSFTIESTRFVNYDKKIEPGFIVPYGIRERPRLFLIWRNAIRIAENMYRIMVRSGVSPQLARSVFPLSLSSRMAVTCNLRNWRHFFLLRTTKETHPQFREITIPLLREFQTKIPLLFDDIIPESRQSDNVRMAA